MKKRENYFYVGLKNIYVLDENLTPISRYENSGFFDLENIKNPTPMFEELFELFYNTYKKHNFKTMVLSDLCFHTQVIDIENFPLSQSKREEVLAWKLNSILPYSVNSYTIKYHLVSKNRILFYSLPVTIQNAANKLFKKANLKCWNVLPESFFIIDFLPQLTRNTLFVINRKDYFTAVFFRKNISYIKVRRKVEGIPFEQEIELIKKVIYEKLSEKIDDYIICGEDNIPGFKKLFKGFGFED